MNTVIEPVSTHGDLIVYRRKTPDPGRPRFVVIRDSDGKSLEEFRQYRNAAKWADENKTRARNS